VLSLGQPAAYSSGAPGSKPGDEVLEIVTLAPAVDQLTVAFQDVLLTMPKAPTVGWVKSKRGRLADVNFGPAGGYLVTDEYGKIKTVLGRGFAAPEVQTVDRITAEDGVRYFVRAQAFTYQGTDGKYYTLAVVEDKVPVMHGVWLDGASRSASNLGDAGQFRVLPLKR
jgi:hypothetical protein